MKEGNKKQKCPQWLTPFKKQCFVTAGVSLNMANQGLSVGYSATLVPQLRAAGSSIPVDEAVGSWIASILGFAVLLGNFVVPTIMARYGRRAANLASISTMLVGWFGVITSNSIRSLLIFRFCQGLSIGMTTTVAPILIGEYTSPRNRGAFLTTLSLALAGGVLVVHTLGSFLHWQMTGLIIAIITFVDLLIVFHSPESPSWLADQGRYEECRRVFHWLRGDGEDKELECIIEASSIVREARKEAEIYDTFVKKVRKNWVYLKETIQKKEFFKPIFIMIHIYTLGQWAGANILSAHAIDVYHGVIGPNVDVALMIISVDTQRIISNACAVYVIRKVKRKTMLLSTVLINISAFLMISGYTYGREQNLLPFDHPAIGVTLIHILMFAIATGTVPLPLVIAGELFPLEYRTLAGTIGMLFYSINFFLTIKTLPGLFSSIGIYGTCGLYAAIVAYCLVVTMIFLPETKDRTLQDIENEFRGRPLSPEELKSTQSLARRYSHVDRRLSVPMI